MYYRNIKQITFSAIIKSSVLLNQVPHYFWVLFHPKINQITKLKRIELPHVLYVLKTILCKLILFSYIFLVLWKRVSMYFYALYYF